LYFVSYNNELVMLNLNTMEVTERTLTYSNPDFIPLSIHISEEGDLVIVSSNIRTARGTIEYSLDILRP